MDKIRTSKENKLLSSYLTAALLLVVILLLIGTGYLMQPFIKNTELYKNYQINKEITFVSKRANFSFKHPNWWPVSVVDFETKNRMYAYLAEEDGVIEYVDFEEEFHSQAGWPTLGFIIVEKSKYKNLKEYVDELSKEKVVDMYVKGATQKVTIHPPKIKYLKIGGEDTIGVTDTNQFASFTRETADYRLIRKGWLYRFATTDSTKFSENKERNSKTFQQIIASVKFLD